MKRAVLLLALILPCTLTGADGEEHPTGFLDRHPALRALAECLEFPWAKQVRDADMETIESLLESGILSDTEADWYVELPEVGEDDG
jgi:hypothetical protein